MTSLNEIIHLIPKISVKNKALIEKAYFFAQRAHEGQKRNSGEPYFSHVFETAKNLAEYGMDTKTVVAGLLHDVFFEALLLPYKHTFQDFLKHLLLLFFCSFFV
jgi:GTP pyrophosphokinase